MPLGYLRRPLFLAALALLRYRYASGVTVLGTIVSPLREDRRGQKVTLRAESIEGQACRQDILVFLPRAKDGRVLRPGMTVSLLVGNIRALITSRLLSLPPGAKDAA